MKPRALSVASPRPAGQRGLSMVELLVALAIGSLLIVGAVFVYSQSRTTHALSETVARLQENARFAMSLIEPDVELAGNYGYFNVPSVIRFSDGTFVSDMEPGDAQFDKGPASGVHECGRNFAYNLQATVQGIENTFDLTCAAFGTDGAADQADTLIIRRASTTSSLTADPAGKKLQLETNRTAPLNQVMFTANVPPLPTKADFVDVRDMITHVYYVSKDSDDRDGYPSLRRKSLEIDSTGALAMVDEEIMAGVEDMQVQFGVDMGADRNGDGVPDDVNANGVADIVNGQVSRYVNADDAGKAAMKFGQVVAVRVWLRLRAERGEVGYKDTTKYDYGSADFTASDNIRRIVATRTFFLRNTRIYPKT